MMDVVCTNDCDVVGLVGEERQLCPTTCGCFFVGFVVVLLPFAKRCAQKGCASYTSRRGRRAVEVPMRVSLHKNVRSALRMGILTC